MLALRPLLALITAFTLLVALPVAGADAKRPPAKQSAKQKAAKKKHKNKKRKGKKRPKPGQASPAEIGSVTEVDGDLVTVTLTRGGSITAEVTDTTEGACETEPDESEDGDDILDLLDDDSEDADDDDGPDTRSQRLDGCAATVGAAVYSVTVDEGEYDVLDLAA